MAFFERFKLNDSEGQTINPAKEESLQLLRRIFQALKPLGQITGGGSNRLSVDINNVVNFGATVAGVTNLTNLTPGNGAIGPVTGGGFELMKTLSRQSYNSGIRSRIT
jgi:hypothetical protein